MSFKVTTRHGDVQVLSRMPAIPPYAGLRAAADQGKVEGDDGTIATVCSLADLREMKIASDRPRDLVDVAELDELHGRP